MFAVIFLASLLIIIGKKIIPVYREKKKKRNDGHDTIQRAINRSHMETGLAVYAIDHGHYEHKEDTLIFFS